MNTPAESTQYSPTDDQVLSLAIQIKNTSPSIGLSKLLSALKSQAPTWTLSEKVPSTDNASELTVASEKDSFKASGYHVGIQRDFTAYARNCCPDRIGSEDVVNKREGPLCYYQLREGVKLIFKESPFVWVAGPEVWKLPAQGHCAFCGKVFGNLGASLRVNCKECKQGNLALICS